MKKYSLLLLSLITLLSFSCKKENTPEKTWALYDIDKNGYDTVKIGTQFWMKQNLNTSHYRNGDPIPQVTTTAVFNNLSTGAWCWYNNDSATYAATYGKLYNWFAVNDPRGLAPEGWHIPQNFEWDILIAGLGGNTVAGSALKETGTSHWASPNADATNKSRFTGLPGGFLGFSINVPFQNQGTKSYWWSSSYQNSTFTYVIDYSNGSILKEVHATGLGCSIRCTKD